MDGKYVEGFAKRYSIMVDGNVVCHYRFTKKGKVKGDVILSKNKTNHKNTNYTVALQRPDKTISRISVFKLMARAFSIEKPDKNHKYIPLYVDGDYTNHCLTNIGWKLYIRSNFNFYPTINYLHGNIVSKKCGQCGNVKYIKHFYLRKSTNCYKNICTKCVNFNLKKNLPTRSPHSYEAQTKWANSLEGILYRNSYQKKYRKSLKISYIRNLIRKRGLNPDVFNMDMINIIRQQVLIKREVNSR